MAGLVILHALTTFALLGLIWTIQLVHYPLFAYADRRAWGTFHEAHARRVTWVVGVLMPCELLLALALAWTLGTPAAWSGLGLLGVVWLSTVLVQVPLHQRLSRGFDRGALRALVATNWVRTAAWTMRAALAAAMLAPVGA